MEQLNAITIVVSCVLAVVIEGTLYWLTGKPSFWRRGPILFGVFVALQLVVRWLG